MKKKILSLMIVTMLYFITCTLTYSLLMLVIEFNMLKYKSFNVVKQDNNEVVSGVSLCLLNILSETNIENVTIDTYKVDIVQSPNVNTTENILACDKYLYATDTLNIRSNSNIESEVIGKYTINDLIHVTGELPDTEFVQVDHNGTIGYVHSKYISTEKQSEKYLGYFEITGYCPCAKCCGVETGITASGAKATANRTVSMYGIPFGTKVKINNNIYIVEDRGTPYGRFDIYFDTHEEAVQFALQHSEVYVILE